MVAVVKANAYGHGAKQVSKAALQASADMLAVALPEEGAELRAAGFTVPILSLGLILPEQASLLAENNLIATVSTIDHLDSLAQAAKERGIQLQVFLKVDTGMGRIGISPEQVGEYLEAVSKRPSLKVDRHLYPSRFRRRHLQNLCKFPDQLFSGRHQQH